MFKHRNRTIFSVTNVTLRIIINQASLKTDAYHHLRPKPSLSYDQEKRHRQNVICHYSVSHQEITSYFLV